VKGKVAWWAIVVLTVTLDGVMHTQPQVAGAAGDCTVAAEDLVMEPDEVELLSLLNQYRTENGARPVVVDDDLRRSAEWMARDMAHKRYFGHRDSFDRTPGARMTACGFSNPYTWRGEDLAGGQWTPEDAMWAWKHSPGHNSLMLDPKYKVVGVAMYRLPGSPYVTYWVMDFASEFDDDSQPVPTAAAVSPTVRATRTPVATRTPAPTGTPASGRSPSSTVTPGLTAAPPRGNGLLGQYFDDLEMTTPRMARTDPQVNFDWDRSSPNPGTLEPDTFAVRWTGYVRAERAERYTFHTMADDGTRLWVDGQELIDNWRQQRPAEDSGSIELTQGWHAIKLEYVEHHGEASVQLLWSSEGKPKEVIPTGSLAPSQAR
jgi:uncharacterized protein YkwD